VHLVRCTNCRREIEEFRAVLAGIRAVSSKDTLDWPEGEWKGLMARIRSVKQGPRPVSPFAPIPKKAWAYGFAIVLVLGIAALILKTILSPPATLLLTEIMMPTTAQPSRALRADETSSARYPQDLPFRVYERREGPDRVLLAAVPAPDKTTQNMMSMILVSQETGLKVHWTFNRNFDWKEKKK
jgi:hypothetical protein